MSSALRASHVSISTRGDDTPGRSDGVARHDDEPAGWHQHERVGLERERVAVVARHPSAEPDGGRRDVHELDPLGPAVAGRVHDLVHDEKAAGAADREARAAHVVGEVLVGARVQPDRRRRGSPAPARPTRAKSARESRGARTESDDAEATGASPPSSSSSATTACPSVGTDPTFRTTHSRRTGPRGREDDPRRVPHRRARGRTRRRSARPAWGSGTPMKSWAFSAWSKQSGERASDEPPGTSGAGAPS